MPSGIMEIHQKLFFADNQRSTWRSTSATADILLSWISEAE